MLIKDINKDGKDIKMRKKWDNRLKERVVNGEGHIKSFWDIGNPRHPVVDFEWWLCGYLLCNYSLNGKYIFMYDSVNMPKFMIIKYKIKLRGLICLETFKE